MYRTNVITTLVTRFNYKSYLELGLRDPDSVFNHIPCKTKHSVDINIDKATFKMSTNDFFQQLNNSELNLSKDFKWDVIFIDANHLADFVKNDMDNSLLHLNDDGIIITHDTLPPDFDSQLEDRRSQTAWKVIPYILKSRPDLHVCTISEVDGGLGIIKKNKIKKRLLLDNSYNIFYEYYLMNSNRKISQNHIEFEKLFDWIENPFYNFENSNQIVDLNRFNDPSKVQYVWK